MSCYNWQRGTIKIPPKYWPTLRSGVITAYNREHKAKDHKAVSRTCTLLLDDSLIHLDNKTRMVHWHVPENNRAVERAHEDPVARALFRELSDVMWTAQSGGTIVGNDEYNQDSEEAGGGGNYTVMTFSKKEQEIRRRTWRHRG